MSKSKNKILKELEMTKTRAHNNYVSLPLPDSKTEEWKYTHLETDFNSLNKITEKIIFKSSKEQKNKGIIFCSMREAIEKYPKSVFPFLLNQKEATNKTQAFNDAFWGDGIFLYVPKNTHHEIEIESYNIIEKEGNSNTKTIIVLDENSSLTYLQKNKTTTKKQVFRTESIYVYTKEHSKLNYYLIFGFDEKTENITDLKATLKNNSNLNLFFAQRGGKLNRVKADIYLENENTMANVYGIFKGEKEENHDITTNLFHNARNTAGDIVVKGVLYDKSSSVYRGKIKITKKGQGTNSFLSNYTLMLGEEAVSNSIPSLEIDADEVKASHSATTGKPEEETIFYLMSRGLKKEEAEKLLTSGFLNPIINNINSDKIKKEFIGFLEKD